MNKLCVAVVMVSMLIAGISLAETNVVYTGTLDVPVLSSFNSRGRIFTKGTVIQPNVTLNRGTDVNSLFLNVWGNVVNDKGVNNKENLNEIDVTAGVANTIDKISYGAGVIGYIYNGQGIPNTSEIYFSLTGLVLLNPSVAAYYDWKEAKGYYVVGNVSHIFDLTDKYSVTADTGLGFGTSKYNSYYFEVDKDSLNDWNSGLTLAIKTIKHVGCSIGVRYVDLIDNDIGSGAKSIYGKGDSIVTKAAITATF